MTASDTIAAIATPPGRGGIGVIRVSGPATRTIAQALLGRVPAPRRAGHRSFRGADGQTIDSGIALFFPTPSSFTGEDVLELQGHGGPVVLDIVLERVLGLGARLARPGEFSERAFLNGRLDLAQAEAVADLIDSGSRQAARSALRSLEGEFSARITALVERLTETRVYVEAAIDFSDEDIDFLAEDTLHGGLRSIAAALTELIEAARQGCVVREGLRVVIAGRPNVGKSSLLNRLARREAAIVSDIPGTTRDVLREYLAIDGLPLHVVDTAGLRDSRDPIERIGVERARAELGQADRVLWVVDDVRSIDGELAQSYRDRLTILHNKIDLAGTLPSSFTDADGVTHIHLSALTGAGLDLLAAHLKACAGYQGSEEGAFTARRRHLDALHRAADQVAAAARRIDEGRASELAAEELRLAQQALGEITGEVTNEELLGRIFASFCIGK